MGTNNEVWIGPEDPRNLDPNVELWFNPLAVSASDTATTIAEWLSREGYDVAYQSPAPMSIDEALLAEGYEP